MNIKDEIKALKEQKNAVILAHYYVADEIQEIADYVGDSFALSKTAATLPNPIIVYCGVSFMGESGCLLSPEKKVLMPDASADCPMAHMVTKAEVDAAREAYEDLAVVCYINSTAEIKSWSDVSVTSANAVISASVALMCPIRISSLFPIKTSVASLRRRCLKKISFSSMATVPSIRISLLPRYRS